MEYDDVLKCLSPCGLDCSRCADYEGGEISRLSLRLGRLLENYGRVAKMKADAQPVFKSFSQFEEVLGAFARASCEGCRSEKIQCPVRCNVKSCHKEKGVDFCFQCAEYPCEEPVDERLRERWRQRNDRMKDVGVLRFYDEQSRSPRY